MNRQAHFETILTRARARPNLIVHDSTAPLNGDGTVVRASYVVLHDHGPDEISDRRYTGSRDGDEGRTMRVIGRCVGEDPAAARRVASALIGQLTNGWTPIVPGRICWPLLIDDESEAIEDDKVSPSLWYVDVDFTYRSNRGG
ncbi:hypothetical protein [Microbacterium sp. MMO-10]|uniref:hypothetical protein n=1 Tax=Microbacterium sp. MMO-10 TaxID=3081272 RepID=UPI00301811DC